MVIIEFLLNELLLDSFFNLDKNYLKFKLKAINNIVNFLSLIV